MPFDQGKPPAEVIRILYIALVFCILSAAKSLYEGILKAQLPPPCQPIFRHFPGRCQPCAHIQSRLYQRLLTRSPTGIFFLVKHMRVEIQHGHA